MPLPKPQLSVAISSTKPTVKKAALHPTCGNRSCQRFLGSVSHARNIDSRLGIGQILHNGWGVGVCAETTSWYSAPLVMALQWMLRAYLGP